MKIRVLSDLHNEFGDFVIPSLPEDKDTVLVLAGDIDIAVRVGELAFFIKEAALNFRAVIFVAGNHEYYFGHLGDTYQHMRSALDGVRNVHFLENASVVVDDVLFVGATLWTDFNKASPLVMHASAYGMNDYKVIMAGDNHTHALPEDTLHLHNVSREYIFDTVRKEKANHRKIVVVVHHLPTYQSIPERFVGDMLNGAFASELGDLILDTEPDVVIHGHTHDSCDYTFGYYTRIVCNPRGYHGRETNPNFNPTFTIEV